MTTAETGVGKRPHRFLVPTLLILATLIGFAGAFAVWVNRQALNTDNWATTSGKLLADQKIQTALSAYLVNDRGDLTDDEFASEKAHLVTGNGS